MSNTERKKILMVDDSKIQIFNVNEILKENYDFISAKSGKLAMELIDKGFIPDLILLDILMPDTDGLEIFKRIKSISKLQNVPIAFLSSLKGEDEEEIARDLGAADYITKPFNNDDLLERIKKMIQ